MPVYRFVRTGLSIDDIKKQVPPVDAPSVSLGDTGPTQLLDISAPTTSLDDLTDYMIAKGWAYDSTDPVKTPAEQSAEDQDHGELAGLSDDDHTIYHNDTRGDVRYYQKTEWTNKTQLDLITDGDHDVRTDNPHSATAAQVGAAPSSHALGGANHSTDTLANINTKVSDATLDDSGDPRDPNSHASSHQHGGSDEIATATPAANAIPKADASGKLNDWVDGSGSGDVVGPASATDEAIARYNGTTGKLIQNSGATITDAGLLTAPNISTPGNITVSGTVDGRDVALDGTNQDNHIASTSNPHSVTAGQAGAAPTVHTHVETDITDLSHTDPDAIHDNVASEISGIVEKTSPIYNDLFIIEDSADSNNKKKVQLGNLQVQDAEDLMVYAMKGSVGTINPGQPIRVSGYNLGQDMLEVELADASNSSTMPALGISRTTITNVTSGIVVISGSLTGQDTSSWAVGTELYVSETAGTLTSVKPTGSALVQKVSQVIRSNISVGVLQVFGAGRTNDLPNIPQNNIWLGNASGAPTETSRSGIDDTAIHDNVSGEISSVTAKASPTTSDYLLIEDASASNTKKSITVGDLPAATPSSHAGSHENGGGDEISVAGLSGVLADAQTPSTHASAHEPGGGDALTVDAVAGTGSLRTLGTGAQQACSGSDSRLSDDRTADGLRTATTIVGIDSATAPTTGQLLKATSSTSATWQNDNAIHNNVNSEINSLTEKGSPIGADLLLIEDSAASYGKKKVQITSLPTGSDADAIHDNVSAEISAITEKTTPVSTDLILIEDSAASNSKKRVQIGNLPGGGGGGLTTKAGSVTQTNFTGNYCTITFTTAFSDSDYSISFSASSLNAVPLPFWRNKAAASFRIYLHDSIPTGVTFTIDWTCTKHGES